jgi:hypothetical protein
MSTELKEGTKNDQGKPRWDLFPFDAAEQIVLVLNFGANKYTNYLTPGKLCDIIGIECNCENRTVIDGGSITPRDSVETAMNSSLDGRIPPLSKDSARIVETGRQHIEERKPSMTQSMDGQSRENAEHCLQDKEGLLSLTSPLKTKTESLENKVMSAPSVNEVQEKAGGIWTTTTPQGKFVASCVDSATRALGSSVILSKVLEAHSPTCNVRKIKPTIINNQIAISGERNWEKGIKYGRVFGALIRHTTTWFMCKVTGQTTTDPETGLSHLAHAGCCILFLLAYETRKMTDFDDRPIFPPITVQ